MNRVETREELIERVGHCCNPAQLAEIIVQLWAEIVDLRAAEPPPTRHDELAMAQNAEDHR